MRRWGAVFMMCSLTALTGSAAAQAPDLERMDVVLKSVPDGPVAKVHGVSFVALQPLETQSR